MRRVAAGLAVVAAVCVFVPAASAHTFTVLSADAQALPSSEAPNAGAIAVPVALSTPPANPASFSYDELRDLWQRAGAAYGVPWEVLAAINKVESNFGRNMGPSSAGAVGWMQFLPSTWMRWGVDADGDGIADPWDPEDAVFSAGRYLAAAGAHDDVSRAIFAYNHAQWYVDEVLALAAQFDSGGGGFSAGLDSSAADFRLAALQEQQDEARRAVTRAQRLIPRTRATIARLEHRQLVLTRRAGDASLTTWKFKQLETRLAGLERTERRAAGLLERRRADRDAAVAALESVQDQLAAAAVAAPAAAALGSPASVDGYVFPVGGGPEVVSVGHHHHDYPAADIAAPEGSPLYALADSVVVETYASGNCGIGFKLLLAEGTSYTYCHLSYLEPGIAAGTALAAGAPVGLVGETGHATGPHLHLQLNPPDRYPQDEPWFQSFAGVAFSWQDAPTPRRAPRPSGRVFTVVGGGDGGGGGGDPFSSRVVTFTR